MIEAFYLMGWHGVALTLAYVWIVAKRLTRKAMTRETWIEGPRGRIALGENGWPLGTETWVEARRRR